MVERRLEIPGYPHPKPQEVPLEAIRAYLGDCHRCPLGETRTTLVFGSGNPHARVMFIGEAPGRNEDLQGVPFVGAAGKNLEGLLALAGLRREDVYIANVLKCRPPMNRDPQPFEIAECSPFLREQIRSIWPDVIVCLGNFAMRFVLKTDQGITSMRGRFYQVGHFAVLPVFHPAAALYHRANQEALEDDFRMLGVWLAEHSSAQSMRAQGEPTAEAASTPEAGDGAKSEGAAKDDGVGRDLSNAEGISPKAAEESLQSQSSEDPEGLENTPKSEGVESPGSLW